MKEKYKYPFIHALAAAAYIVFIVFVIGLFADNPAVEGTLLIPMVMLSLFVLSAAVMGFLFVYEPLQLYFDNRRHEATIFFLKTVGYFACFVVLFVVTLLYSSGL